MEVTESGKKSGPYYARTCTKFLPFLWIRFRCVACPSSLLLLFFLFALLVDYFNCPSLEFLLFLVSSFSPRCFADIILSFFFWVPGLILNYNPSLVLPFHYYSSF